MIAYDSTQATKKHIIKVGEYLDTFCEKLNTTDKVCNDITKATLVDLILWIINDYEMPEAEIFTTLKNNTISDTPIDICDKKEYLKYMIYFLKLKKKRHDLSKLYAPEKKYFDIWTPYKNQYPYGSKEYLQICENLKPALEHHYKVNRHHPEHYANGIYGMNILDATEAFFDWKATSDEQINSDFAKGLKINEERFEYSPELTLIFNNTAKAFPKK